jgi:hypothetical protein
LLQSEDGFHLYSEPGKDLSTVQVFFGGKNFDVLEGIL